MTGRKPALTREQALAIRNTYQRHQARAQQLARQYDVSAQTIHNVIRGIHVSVTDLPNIARGRRR